MKKKVSEKNNRLYDLCDSIKQYSIYVFQIQIEKTERDRNTAEKLMPIIPRIW